MAKDFFKQWEKHPPAFLAHVGTELGFGSGIQVDAQHVVTCAHVLGPPPPSGFARPPSNERPDVINQTAQVSFSGFETRAVAIAQHARLDLALLRLDKPRPGIIAPLFARADYRGEACVVGVRRDANRFIAMHSQINITGEVSSEGGLSTHGKHEKAAIEGSSGGGVFAYDQGMLLFVGIPYLGGETAWMGAYIHAEAVFDFLAEQIDFVPPAQYPKEPHARLLWQFGFAPALEFQAFDSQRPLKFAAVVREAAGAYPDISFVCHQVISAAQTRRQMSAKILPGHWRLPAWARTIEQAEAAIKRLERLLEWRLRLPTVDELEAAWRMPSSLRTPMARPLNLADFTANERGIEVPPLGASEWARDRNGNAYAVESHKTEDGRFARALAADRVGQREPCFRAVFDLEAI